MEGGKSPLLSIEPAAALAAVASYHGPVIVDLDETLYLRNSTEDYIDTARPALPAAVLMRVLDLVRPWRWTGGSATRDVWRVRAIRTLFRSTDRRWRGRVPELAALHVNAPLLRALRSRADESPPVVATIGFRRIVEPLVDALDLPGATVVAAAEPGFDDRLRGKLAMVIDELDEDCVRRAAVLTDSTGDAALLGSCAQPLLTTWPSARYRRAFSDTYLPGLYLTQVKRPGERYVVRAILQEDFAFWVLSSIGLAAAPLLHVAALLCLLASFWTIYELGYVDNDRAGERYETRPKLSASYHEHPVATPSQLPWAWALATGALGIVLLRLPLLPAAIDLAKWGAVLLATYAWFRLYNRFDGATRVWMFAGLQFARVAAFTALVAVTPVGAAALAAHVLSRWVPYCAYRSGATGWPDLKAQAMRLLFFVVLAALLGIVAGWSSVLNLSGVLLLGWCLYRARGELAAILSSASRIDRTGDRTLP